MTALKNIEINTWKFRASHGKSPRGFGLWMFTIGNITWDCMGTYADACKRAKRQAQTWGIHSIIVMP